MEADPWAPSSSGYLTYQPVEPRSLDRPVMTPATAQLSVSTTSDMMISPPALNVREREEIMQPRRYSHLVPNSPVNLRPVSAQTAPPGILAQPITLSEPPAIASNTLRGPLPRQSSTTYPSIYSHHSYSHTSHFGPAYSTSFDDLTHISPSLQSVSPRPSISHYHSSPWIPGVPIERGFDAPSASSSTHQQSPISTFYSHSSSSYADSQPSPQFPASSYPVTQRHWVSRRPAPPRLSVDTGEGAGRSSGEGSYSTSPITQRLPSATSLNIQHYIPAPTARSSSSSFPSLSQATSELPTQVKQEDADGNGADHAAEKGGATGRAGRSGEASKPVSARSNRSWSGVEDEVSWSGDLEPWGMPQEEYKAMSSRDKKQVRNRVGARRFRAKRKDYVTSLEDAVRDKDERLSDMSKRLQMQREEIIGYRRQLGMGLDMPPSPIFSEDSLGLGLIIPVEGDGENLETVGADFPIGR